jgi:heme/copper-type cytochrome/quinol oxidase subunit 2
MLYNIILVVATLVFLVVTSLLVYSLVHFRHNPDNALASEQFQGNAMLETLWTLIPIGVLVALLILTLNEMTR